ncbi:MAG: hypothetical protein RBT30_00970 [Patescibacteria group bacterium]|jgi:hypothetical protein|nr:hypothetical protein [Patescibacteria group bacterium]
MEIKMKTSQKLKRASSLYELSKKMTKKTETLKLLEDGFGSCDTLNIINQLKEDCSNFIFLLNRLELTKKEGEDQDRIISC